MATTENAAPGLVVLWVTADREAALNMVLMYAKNSRLKGWWDDVHLVVWGPSARLLATDVDMQAEVAACREAGVTLLACRACAERYGVAEKLAALGADVIYMGAPLTGYLKDGWHVLSV
jgi:hypothetical protein